MNYDDYQIEVAAAVTFAVVFVGILVFGLQSLLLEAFVIAVGIWTLYRVVGGRLYGRAREAWREVAESLGLEFHEPRIGNYPYSSTIPDGLAYFVMFLANDRRNFELSGTVEDEPIAVATERTRVGRSMVICADFSDQIPDWLRVRENANISREKPWVRARDVPAGRPMFDEAFLVHGPDSNATREFFDTHPITDVLVDLSESFPHIEIIDGEVYAYRPTVPEDADQMVTDIETFAGCAGRLRERLERPETVADFQEDEEERRAAEKPAYESSTAGTS